jgi:hypothetical protein
MAKDFTDPDYVIRVQFMQERDATIVSLGTDYATVKGSARRDPQDKHDPEVAYDWPGYVTLLDFYNLDRTLAGTASAPRAG